jgi:hypothetical protein
LAVLQTLKQKPILVTAKWLRDSFRDRVRKPVTNYLVTLDENSDPQMWTSELFAEESSTGFGHLKADHETLSKQKSTPQSDQRLSDLRRDLKSSVVDKLPFGNSGDKILIKKQPAVNKGEDWAEAFLNAASLNRSTSATELPTAKLSANTTADHRSLPNALTNPSFTGDLAPQLFAQDVQCNNTLLNTLEASTFPGIHAFAAKHT